MPAPVAPGRRAALAWSGAWVLASAIAVGIMVAPAETLVVHFDRA